MQIVHSRRRFLSQLGVTGVAGLGGVGAAGLGGGARSLAAEPPPEITTIPLEKAPVTCLAPQYVAEGLLRAEGFTDIRYRTSDKEAPTQAVAHNELDWDLDFAPDVIADLDNGAPVTMIAGVHAGCFELIAHDHVRSIADLKGRTVGWSSGYVSSRYLVSLMAKFVGLDPAQGYPLGQRFRDRSDGSFHRSEDRRLPGRPATVPGASRPQDRALARQQRHRPSVVAVFLLHAGRQDRVRPEISDCDQTRRTGPAEGDRPMRQRTGTNCTADRRSGIH